jgi:benzoylformate decarboxylase
MTGIEAFLEMLAAAGVRYLFGNPGSTELALNDAVAADARFQYILGLQEVPVVSMADGYAMASQSIGVVNVHIACGLGNAMGMLYNAHCAGTPLLLTAGQQDRRLRMEEPVLVGELCQVARPWTKWAYEVQRVEDVPVAVRRAVQTALTPPTGPVFLALPLDVQTDSSGRFDLAPPHIPDRRVRPPREALQQAARILAAAQRPAFLAGSRVMESGGAAELAAVAQRLGAAVFDESASSHGRLPIATDHPCYAGSLPLWSPDVIQLLAGYDVLFAVGINLLRQYLYHEPARPLPADARLVQLDDHPWEIGKNYAVEVGLLGDPKTGLAELDSRLAETMSAAQVEAARQRCERLAARRADERERLAADLLGQRDRRPMTAATFMSAVGRILPPHAAVVQEATTTHQFLLERLGAIKDPTGYFAHRGWALGWGIGCALGVQLAWPDRPVIGLLGDGAAMFGIQGLWTAARYQIPVALVVANNAQYKILKTCGDVLNLPHLAQRQYVGMDLVQPEIDFVGLARSFGLEADRIHDPDTLSDRLKAWLDNPRPLLLDVPIERD